MISLFLNKRVLILLAFLCAAGGGFYAGSRWAGPKTTTIAQSESTEQAKTTRKITKEISKPDGTKEIVVEEVTENIKKNTEVKDKSSKTGQDSNNRALTSWRLGLEYDFVILEKPELDLKNTRLVIGKRLFESPFWGSIGYKHGISADQRSLTLGLSIEF